MTRNIHAGAALAAALSASLAYAPAASAQQQDAARAIAPRGAPSDMQQVQGRILDTRQVPIRGVKAENELVLIETPQGNNVVVDLGDRQPNFPMQQGQLLQARGRVVEISNQRPILLADTFRYAGLTYDVNRVAFFEAERPEVARTTAVPNQGAGAEAVPNQAAGAKGTQEGGAGSVAQAPSSTATGAAAKAAPAGGTAETDSAAKAGTGAQNDATGSGTAAKSEDAGTTDKSKQ
jgi:hypothetical protein